MDRSESSIKYISTHSLTKRLTRTHSHLPTVESYFNSQPHEEADCQIPFSQSPILHFNSQPHEEADVPWLLQSLLPFISTHSLTKRLTDDATFHGIERNISTHSLTKRLTEASDKHEPWIRISTHSLTKRLTKVHFAISVHGIFQLTASRRG